MTRRGALPPRGRPARWHRLAWPSAAILLVALGLLAWVWAPDRAQRQEYVVGTFTVGFAAALLLGLWGTTWLLFLSGLRWRARLGVVGAGAALVVLLGLSLEFRGFSGDLVPSFGWRWESVDLTAAGAGTGVSRASSPGDGSDWPQFLGPDRDGTAAGVRLARDWSEPPREVWRRPVGAGWSGFAVSGGHTVTQEQREDREAVTCYDLATGRLIWSHSVEGGWDDPLGGPGPRATPAIRNGTVYALGATGRLVALDLATGAPRWSRDILADHGAPAPAYGVAASPLVLGDVVVVAAGGPDGHALVGYDAATGRPLWSGGDGPPAFGSPRHAVLAGVPQILVMNGRGVAAHDPANGRVLWELDWPPGENTAQPVVLPPDRVFFSTGYGVGGTMLRVSATRDGGVGVERLWQSRGLKSKFANVVHRDGFLYGLDDGILVCLDARTGERRWKRGRYGHGQLLLVRDLLLVTCEDGTVALVEAEPDTWRELGRFQAIEGKTWNHPALVGAYLLVRNAREAACYELPLAAGS